MVDAIQPPTDNLYKFLAIGGLASAIILFVLFVRELARERERYIDAHVELIAAGYAEGSGLPTDRELRRAYARREFSKGQASATVQLANGILGRVAIGSAVMSFVGFYLWYCRVQRHDDAILQATAAKILREERIASAVASG